MFNNRLCLRHAKVFLLSRAKRRKEDWRKAFTAGALVITVRNIQTRQTTNLRLFLLLVSGNQPVLVVLALRIFKSCVNYFYLSCMYTCTQEFLQINCDNHLTIRSPEVLQRQSNIAELLQKPSLHFSGSLSLESLPMNTHLSPSGSPAELKLGRKIFKQRNFRPPVIK